MAKATTASNGFLALLYNATTWANIAINATASPITDVYAALHTAPVSAGGNQSEDETAYTNYVRVGVVRTTSGWDAPSGGATANTAAIEFAQCGVTGATITDVSIGKSSAGATDYFHTGALSASIAVSNQIQPRFAGGALTITEA
jgi:hypothetical protein